MEVAGNVAVLQNVVRERFATVDLLMSFASSALESSRSATVARPLPMEPEEARAAMAELAGLASATDLGQCSAKALQLLSFLCFLDVVSLRKVAVSKWAAAAACPPQHVPDAVFEVEYGVMRDDVVNPLARQKHAEFVKAQQLRHSTISAYHGTGLCNLHNVLREGLKNDVKLAGRNGAIFGKGVYLSEELTVASNFLSFGRGRSGEDLACMLECEVVVDPAQVLRGDEQMSSGVPAKYVVVKNDCLVRPRRLLVYRHKKAKDLRWLGSLLATLIALLLLAMMLIKKGTVPMERLLFWQ